jgi:hypothetical protein
MVCRSCSTVVEADNFIDANNYEKKDDSIPSEGGFVVTPVAYALPVQEKQ